MFTSFSAARLVLPGALALLALAAASCSSTGANSGGNRTESPLVYGSVTYTNAGQMRVLGLISASMLEEMGIPGESAAERALAYSSNPENSANIKICTDEFMRGVVKVLGDQGFDKYAIEGAADGTDRSVDGALEIRLNGTVRHVVNSDDTQTDPEAKITFSKLLTLFAQIWGEVPQYQAVQGQHEFKQAEVSDKLRRQARPQDGGIGLFPGSIR